MSDLKSIKTNHIPASTSQVHPIPQALEECLRERNTALAQLFEVQTESEARITGLHARLIKAEDAANEERTARLTEHEQLRQTLAERETQIVALQRRVRECDCTVETLQHGLVKRDQERQSLDDALAECRTRIAQQDQDLAARDLRIAQLHASTSWRVTAPLRYLAANRRQIASLAGDWLRAIYLALPLPWTLKTKIKGFIFALLTPFLHGTRAYRAWIEFEQNRSLQVDTKRWRNRLRPIIAEWIRAIYLVTPLPMPLKVRLKGVLLALFSPLFKDTRAYQDWVAFEAKRNHQGATALSKTLPQEWRRGLDNSIEGHVPPAHGENFQLPPNVSDPGKHSAPLTETQTGSTEVPAEPAAATPLTLTSLRNADGHFEWEDYTTIKRRIFEIERTRRDGFTPEAPYLIDIGDEDLRSAATRIQLPSPAAHPEVSIIIPAYNQAKFTVECLLSISASLDALTTFEVLVADDKSTDDTGSLLAKVPHLKLIRGKRNVGFLRNCNNAAARAKGEFLVFLNNDTQVTHGWLSELVKAAREHTNCAAVGPKLIYPSGYLQEAGATLRRDCTTEMIGLNDDPGLPRYNYVRDVDYCSGACLLINAAIFRELGGFDDAYAPAYCEDADLCLRIKHAGYRVLYCPGSEVVHHLSKTSDDLSQNYKLSCIAKNLQTFSQRWQTTIDDSSDVRLIAFYLPQFHPIPENDLWWGKGFTEWTNVAKAQPNFIGHYQPRLPADFGYYDLRVPEVMERQAELARRYGIYGFCFYYYWFASKRLLEYPIERILDTDGPSMPFCLCWANENWTRRWDGQEHEILMAQDHSDDDDVSVIRDLIRYFRHPHYIRIDNKPLILVYRVSLFPDFQRTAGIWRHICDEEGIGPIYIAMAESFELVTDNSTPDRYGCDAAVEFPPHGSAAKRPPQGAILNPAFTNNCTDYREFAVSYATRAYPPYKRFRCVMPGWDNTARRQNDGFIFENSTPGAFQALLETAIAQTRAQFCGSERLVFINAWNEWAEGAYLEPDRRFGHTFLEAVLNAKQAAPLLRENGIKYLCGD